MLTILTAWRMWINYTAATGGADPKMGYQSPPLLANGITTTLMEYQPKEMQQMQAEPVYCHEVFDGHGMEDQASCSPGQSGDCSRQGSAGPFDRPQKTCKAPWDSEMTHFFISEYRNVSGMVTKKRDAFLHISDKMNQKGYDVTPYTVEKKWHNLIKAYKNVLYRAIRKGDEKISWEYFEEMDDIIKNSTPSLPAPGNLKRLAMSRKVSPNPVASPASGPETISVTPDFLPSPPSPDVTTPKTLPASSPSVAEGPSAAPCAPYSFPAGSSSTRSPPGHLASSPISYVVNPSHPSLPPSEAQHSTSHLLPLDTTSQLHPPHYTQHHFLPPIATTPTMHSQPPTILNTPTVPPPLQPTVSSLDPQSTTTVSLGSENYVTYTQPGDVAAPTQVSIASEQPAADPQGTNTARDDEEVPKKKTLLSASKRKKWRQRKAKLFYSRFRRPDWELLVAQREMNTQLKSLNSNIRNIGHTLNENILGLKRAVERMVSIMLQNKAASS
ncbi:uncharacterized protein LOC123512823 isoform X3 [Portunus trituberculatus]|uniref:uncharacterized protein LOC123512823 isoform X3 n=1 Tax=Portunus trituberculatus TaxID=210409 RepID=UPI001E1CBE5F|nr:uncharacterized protein LOC123512823 isoform X3 [Portunus trituberculatus]